MAVETPFLAALIGHSEIADFAADNIPAVAVNTAPTVPEGRRQTKEPAKGSASKEDEDGCNCCTIYS